jgi:hypothetical protein
VKGLVECEGALVKGESLGGLSHEKELGVEVGETKLGGRYGL